MCVRALTSELLPPTSFPPSLSLSLSLLLSLSLFSFSSSFSFLPLCLNRAQSGRA